MKIRCGFVSNSSSSSFVIPNTENLENYKELSKKTGLIFTKEPEIHELSGIDLILWEARNSYGPDEVYEFRDDWD